MNKSRDSYKLIMGGNTNVPAMVNCIIQSTLQLRTNTSKESNIFCQIHIFHTEQSLESLNGKKALEGSIRSLWHIFNQSHSSCHKTRRF